MARPGQRKSIGLHASVFYESKETKMDPLFPDLPENLEESTDEELADLLKEHEVAAEQIENEDPEYTKGLSADELIAALEAGIDQIDLIKAEQQKRVEQEEAYRAR